MSFALNKTIMAKAYELLCATPPFVDWPMPTSAEVEFRISRSRKEYGEYIVRPDGTHVLTLSSHFIGNTAAILTILAHEMIHLHDCMNGVKAHHGASFLEKAEMVCKAHDFDLKMF